MHEQCAHNWHVTRPFPYLSPITSTSLLLALSFIFPFPFPTVPPFFTSPTSLFPIPFYFPFTFTLPFYFPVLLHLPRHFSSDSIFHFASPSPFPSHYNSYTPFSPSCTLLFPLIVLFQNIFLSYTIGIFYNL